MSEKKLSKPPTRGTEKNSPMHLTWSSCTLLRVSLLVSVMHASMLHVPSRSSWRDVTTGGSLKRSSTGKAGGMSEQPPCQSHSDFLVGWLKLAPERAWPEQVPRGQVSCRRLTSSSSALWPPPGLANITTRSTQSRPCARSAQSCWWCIEKEIHTYIYAVGGTYIRPVCCPPCFGCLTR